MAVEASEESCFDRDFEFDAPQWIDLGSERDQLENETNSEQFDWWFEKVHPLHSPEVNTTPEPQFKPKKPPLRKSVLGIAAPKLSTETGKSSLSSKSSLSGNKSSLSNKSNPTTKSSLTGKSSLTRKSILCKPKRESETRMSKENTVDETNLTSANQGDEVIKKPRKCWQLNENSSLSFSPRCLSSLPDDLQPKRSNSSSLPSKNSSTLLPARGSTDLSSPSTKREVKNKSLKSARRSCPQKLQKSRQTWNECSTKTKNDDADEELQRIIEQHNKKILSQRSEYDINGRKIRKTSSPLKPAKKENVKPMAVSKAEESSNIDDELRELIDNHNRRIWAAQNSEYDLNGRRIRKGNTTVVAPTKKTKSETKTTPTRSRNLRRPPDTNQKRKTPSTFNKTVACDVEDSTNIENEIHEIINLHNSRLAAKKAKK